MQFLFAYKYWLHFVYVDFPPKDVLIIHMVIENNSKF